jgi:hypothetical protein
MSTSSTGGCVVQEQPEVFRLFDRFSDMAVMAAEE